MTKLKNTKKGMAKKALSVSLVAAMLATSNVPVWAAEDLFSDGSSDVAVEAPVAEEPAAEVEAFSAEPAEAEAPAVEEANVNDVATYAASTEYDFSDMDVEKNITWDFSGTPVLSGTIKDADGNAVQSGQLKFKWLVDGIQMFSEKDASDLAGSTSEFKVDKSNIGSKLEVLFYYTDSDSDQVVVNRIDLGTIQAMDISKEFSITDIADVAYTGKVPEQEVKLAASNWSTFQAYASECGVTGAAESWFNYSYNSSNGANAGSTVTVTATLKNDIASKLGYTGTLSNQYSITKATGLADEQVEISVAVDTAGEYTGSAIELSPSDVTVKLAGTDITLPVKKVVTTSTAATIIDNKDNGNANIQVFFDAAAMNATGNFEVSDGIEKTVVDAVSIKQRDLSNCSAKLNVTYTEENVNASNFTIRPDRLTITDANGKKLNLKDDISITLADRKYDHVGTYEDAIVISAKTDNCVNKAYADLVITEKNFDADNATFENADELGLYDSVADAWAEKDKGEVYYKNSDITFTKDQLGDFLPRGDADSSSDSASWDIVYGNNKNASTKNSLATITVSGKAGSDYEGCSKTFYFVIRPATIKATTDSKTNTVTTAVKDTVKGVEVVSGASAADYKEAIGLAIAAKNVKTDLVNPQADTFTLADGTDYTCEYSFVGEDKKALSEDDDANVAGQFVKVVATVKNTNYEVADDDVTTADNEVEIQGDKSKGTVTLYVPLVEKTIASAEITLDKDSYVYTGENIKPAVTVTANGEVLKEGTDYEVEIKNGIGVGTGTVVVTALAGSGFRPGSQITKDFTITKANAQDLTVEVTPKTGSEIKYDGKKWNGDRVNYTVELNGVDVKNQFKVTWGDNIDAGKTAGKLTLTPNTKGSKNFEGTKEATFEIKGEEVTGTLKIYDENGKDITSEVDSAKYFYTGSPITFDKVVFTGTDKAGNKLVEGEDYEIVYVDNTDAGKAHVTVVGKGNFVGTESIKKADGTTLDNVIDNDTNAANDNANDIDFEIIGSTFSAKDITIENGVYASGLIVKPQVTVKVGDTTLVEGIDYELVYDTSKAIEATEEANIRLTVKGIHKYNGVSVDRDSNGNYYVFGIDKFDLANATVTSDGESVTVRNGNVIVPSTEYTSEIADGKVTVTATEGNKNYTGTKTVDVDEEEIFVGAPVIKEVQVSGNKATVILEGEAEGATGYDYVISTVNDYQNGRLPNGINKNQLVTETSYQYLDQGIYYAYCHAWVRDENGQKVFGDWSEIMPFSVSAITPEKPTITSVKKSGRNVTVTWTQCDDAQGYDVVLGTAVRKVNGELRPVEYGKAVKKVGKNTYSVTFKSCPKGATFYAGLHAWNRTSETGVKVFSPWSDSVKVTI